MRAEGRNASDLASSLGRLVVLTLAAGCNQLYGLEPTVLLRADGAPDAPGCAGSLFGNPQVVPGMALENSDYDPSTSSDPHELWVTRTTGPSYDLFIATRTADAGPFDGGSTFIESSTTDKDGDAALTSDGLVVMFLSERVMGQSVYESRRTSIGGAFSQPQPVPVPDGAGAAGIDLSFDGLTLYYIDHDQDLRSMHRTARDQPFGPPSPVLATGVTWPSLSPDELELYYQVPMGSGIRRRTRASRTEPFDGNDTQVFASGGDPDVSADSTKLYFSNSGTFVMTRMCD